MGWLPESATGGAPAPGDVLWPEERATIEKMSRSVTSTTPRPTSWKARQDP